MLWDQLKSDFKLKCVKSSEKWIAIQVLKCQMMINLIMLAFIFSTLHHFQVLQMLFLTFG